MTDPALLPELDGRVDLVVSNPPYVPDGARVPPRGAPTTTRRSRCGAARTASTSSAGCSIAAARLLQPGGLLGIEHADQQGSAAAGAGPRARRLRPRSRTTPTSPAGPASPPPAALTDRWGRLLPRGRPLRLLRPRRPRGRPRRRRRARSPRGELVLLPTDTVYGVGADAFTPAAVTGLLAAKSRGRDMPVPVLIGGRRPSTVWWSTLPPAATRWPRRSGRAA